ncbi:substrate-binding periplasmic protein [Pelagibacterium halotolerans]|uniref:substrate-binding periplasmic protein n=1 Tax=Pelagibacterium halotolerans TaxID=531813 RepID=UPI0002DC6788|nr:transporter substrate-binding domain-containing protein [Pelagibacterium halotolerans]QJR18147.1 transporter substrate-binding domain-containing protein [Pelagibacterium halotolerans]
MSKTSRIGLAGIAATLFAGSAFAQSFDIVPRDLYTERMRQEGSKLVFCINPEGVLAAFERDLAQAIGQSLLAEVEFYEVGARDWPTRPLPLDYRIVLTEQQMFIMLAQECDGFMGFLLSASNPDWMTISQPYLSAQTVLVTRSESAALADIPFGETIGVRMMAAGDNRLIQYLGAQAEESTWRRTPYPDNELMLERLIDGTISAGMIWEYGLFGATGGDPQAAGFSYSYDLPFPVDPIEIGIATRAEDTYLNTVLSEAIDALEADGTIEMLLAENGLTDANGN